LRRCGVAVHAQVVPNLVAILILTCIVHCLDTASYASRIAGARTGRLALTGALFSIVSLASRVAYTLQAPLLGSAVDRMVHVGQLTGLSMHFRFIIAAASVGTLLGAVLVPTFTAIFSRGAVAYENHGSFPALLLHTLSLRGFSRISQHFRLPLPETLQRASRFTIPRSFLLLNMLVTAIYTVGVISTIYASALAPELARTATTLSGAINGFGTLLLVILIDPVSALITDQALRGSRPLSEVTHIVVWQVVGRFVGTVLAQLLFVPAALIVVRIAHLLNA
jgi:hypothetical protein